MRRARMHVSRAKIVHCCWVTHECFLRRKQKQVWLRLLSTHYSLFSVGRLCSAKFVEQKGKLNCIRVWLLCVLRLVWKEQIGGDQDTSPLLFNRPVRPWQWQFVCSGMCAFCQGAGAVAADFTNPKKTNWPRSRRLFVTLIAS